MGDFFFNVIMFPIKGEGGGGHIGFSADPVGVGVGVGVGVTDFYPRFYQI